MTPAGPHRLALAAARAEDLAALRAFVSRACAALGASAETAEAMVLAADEVCSNIVLHGYAGRGPGPIEVAVEGAAGRAVVTIADRGAPFDPAAAPAPDLDAPWDERAIGGLGIFLARRLVDEMRYESDPERGNRLTMIKQLAGSDAGVN